MELVIPLIIFIIAVVGYLLIKDHNDKKRHNNFMTAIGQFSSHCTENHRTTREIADAYKKASEESTISLKELHTETLKILTGDRQ